MEVGAGLHGEGVGGVECVGCFVVDGPAGLGKTHFAVSGVLFRGRAFAVGMIAAVIDSPFAAIVRESRFSPGTVEMDDLIAEDVDVDHAADFIWKFGQEVATALGLRLGVAW